MRLQMTEGPRRRFARAMRPWAVVGLALVALALLACAGEDGADRADGAPLASGGGDDARSEGWTASSNSGEQADLDAAFEEEAADGVASGAVAAYAPAPDAAPLAPGFGGRQIARSGGVELRVESVAAAFDAVRTQAVARGGFVAESSFSGDAEDASATMVLRVPTAEVDALLADLRALAVEVGSVRTGTQDLTQQVVDTEARLRNLTAVELRYVELLGEARDIGEILQVQDRLSGVRAEIERLIAQREALADLTQLATVSVGLYRYTEPLVEAEPADGIGQAAADAWAASLDLLRGVAMGAVTVAVFLWWVPPLLAVGWWLWGRIRRSGSGPFAPRPARLEEGAES